MRKTIHTYTFTILSSIFIIYNQEREGMILDIAFMARKNPDKKQQDQPTEADGRNCQAFNGPTSVPCSGAQKSSNHRFHTPRPYITILCAHTHTHACLHTCILCIFHIYYTYSISIDLCIYLSYIYIYIYMCIYIYIYILYKLPIHPASQPASDACTHTYTHIHRYVYMHTHCDYSVRLVPECSTLRTSEISRKHDCR